MNQTLPLSNRAVDLIRGIAEHGFPLATRLDISTPQVPVCHGIAGKQALPLIQADIPDIGRIDQINEFFQAISQCILLPGTRRCKQLPQLRLAITAKRLLDLTGQQPGFHGFSASRVRPACRTNRSFAQPGNALHAGYPAHTAHDCWPCG